jgi:hypothetical protein
MVDSGGSRTNRQIDCGLWIDDYGLGNRRQCESAIPNPQSIAVSVSYMRIFLRFFSEISTPSSGG